MYIIYVFVTGYLFGYMFKNIGYWENGGFNDLL